MNDPVIADFNRVDAQNEKEDADFQQRIDQVMQDESQLTEIVADYLNNVNVYKLPTNPNYKKLMFKVTGLARKFARKLTEPKLTAEEQGYINGVHAAADLIRKEGLK